jgi:hypothetical protein
MESAMVRKANERYRREKFLAKLLGMSHVFASGGTLAGGTEDMQDTYRLGQSKSTFKDRLTVEVMDMVQLRLHSNTRQSVFVLDFEETTLRTPTGSVVLRDEIWCAVPLGQYIDLYRAWLEKIFPDDIT